jgi:cell division protein FtsB
MAKHPSFVTEPMLNPEVTERRHIYNGETINKKTEKTPKGNRPVRSRKRSPFNIIGSLFLLSVLIVFYIWNKICVNRLVIEVNDLHNQYDKILNANEFLNAEINKKSSLERIGKISTEQLGLIAPKEQPVWFEVDFKKADNLRD